MSYKNLKRAAVLSGAFVLAGCASTAEKLYDTAKGYTNQATSAINNQTFDKPTSIKFDDKTGLPSFVADSEGVGACLRSDELRSEVKHVIKTNQSEAALLVKHEQFKSATETCAQHTAYKLGEDFGCAIENGDVVVKATGTEPVAPKECSSENIFLRSTEIKKGAYLPGGKYNL